MAIRRLILPCVAALALGAGACGSSSSTTTTSAAAGTPSGAGSATVVSDAQFQARVNLAKCLRGQGIQVPDQGTTSNQAARATLRRLLATYSITALNHAASACRTYLVQAFPQLAITPAQLAQRRQQVLQYVQCMRSHGIDIPDPTSTAIGAGLGQALRSVDTNSPAFQTANTACANLRPGAAGARGG
jgi:hypothetical protein